VGRPPGDAAESFFERAVKGRSQYPRLRDRVWVSPRYPKVLLLTCLFGMFSTTFTFSVATVAFKQISHDLHTTPGVVAWVVTAPALASAVFLPIFGRLGDVHGHAKVYIGFLVVTILFNLLTAFSPNVGWLIAFRTVAQLTGTATWPSSYAMLFRHFAPHERIRATSWATATLTMSAVTGLVIGGPVISAFGWRPLFAIQSVLGLLGVVPALIVLKPDKPKNDKALDLPGAFLLAATLFCFTFGLNRTATDGVSPLSVTLLCAFPLLLAVLWRTEGRAAAPLLPVRLITNRHVQAVAAATFLLSLGFQGSFVVTPLLLQSVFGLSITLTSLVTACRTASIGAAAPLASRLGVRFGERPVIIVSSLVIAAGMLALAFGATTQQVTIVVAALVVTGFANGHATPANVAMMANAVEQETFGLASSLQQMANQTGAVLGIGLFTAIAADSNAPGPFAVGFVIAAGLATLVAAVIFGATGRSRRTIEAPVLSAAEPVIGPVDLADRS
jgi:MFS family permease